MEKNGIKVCDYCEEPLSYDTDESCTFVCRTAFFKVKEAKDGMFSENLACNDCVAIWMTESPEDIQFLQLEIDESI